MSDGIDTWMIFEVLAKQEDAAVESLRDHVDKMKEMETVEITSEDFEDVEKVEDPHPALDKGYSQVCEVEATVDDFPTLVELVMNYGPTMIEVQGPEEITLDLGEAQDALNLVAEMMQKFLQSGAGGMMISRDSEQ
ncbi:MAG: hypothetical protein SV186_03450 [Candidatus Nanohaloarchaea archaeon]|nr:hypothetical protein [Candidatus Nanohaloarchaea archaeon]